MSGVEVRNRDLLQQGLDLVTGPLYAAMADEFSRERGENWLQELAREKKRRNPVSSDDLASLIALVLQTWHRFGQRFPSQESPVMRNRLGLLKDERNQNAHGNAADRNPEDVLAALRTVELTLVGLEASTAQIEPLKRECVRRLTGAAPQAEAPPRAEADRFEALEKQIEFLSSQLTERAADRPSMEVVLAEVAGVQRSVENLAARVATPQGNEELSEIREHLDRLAQRLDDRTTGLDPQRAVDELLAASQQMRNLGQREQELAEPTDRRPSDLPAADRPVPARRPLAKKATKRPTARKAAKKATKSTPAKRPIKKATKRAPAKRAIKKAPAKQATRHGARWKPAEDATLLRGWEDGRTVVELAGELRRTASAVASRLRERHDLNWMLLAPGLPVVGDVVGWQGLASLVDTAQRRQAKMLTLVTASGGPVVGCFVDETGAASVGPARLLSDSSYQVDIDVPCASAVDCAHQVDRLLQNSSLEIARVIYLDMEEPAQASGTSATPSSQLDNRELADRLRALGFTTSGNPWIVGKYLRECDEPITKSSIQAGVNALASLPRRPANYGEARELLRQRL